MLRLIPIWFDGEITAEECKAIFQNSGFHVKSDIATGKLVAQRVPAFLQKNAPQAPKTNVVRLDRRPGVRRG